MANSVEISVPVPSDADSPRFKTSVGSAKYMPEKNVVIWSIKSFPVSTGDGRGIWGTCPCFLRARQRINQRATYVCTWLSFGDDKAGKQTSIIVKFSQSQTALGIPLPLMEPQFAHL